MCFLLIFSDRILRSSKEVITFARRTAKNKTPKTFIWKNGIA